MRIKRSIIAIALAVPLLAGAVALAVGSGDTVSGDRTAQTRYAPVWHHQPTSVRQAVELSSVVVRARVVGVQQTADLVVPARGEPGGVDRVPTQAITLRAQELLKGSVPATFTVFRTGGPNVIVAGEPAYRMGQQYVLMLTSQRQDGRWVLVSPEGRYLVRSGKVYAISEHPGVATVNGRGYQQFRATVEAAA